MKFEITTDRKLFESQVAPLRPLLQQRARYFHRRDLHKAEDLVQETLYKAYVFFWKFEQGTNLEAWLMTVMKNIYLTWRHRNKRRGERSYDQEPFLVDKASKAVVEMEGLSDEMLTALSGLNPKFVEVLLLADVEGWPHYEIAEHCGISHLTVKSRLHRSRTFLMKALRPGYEVKGTRKQAKRLDRNRMKNKS